MFKPDEELILFFATIPKQIMVPMNVMVRNLHLEGFYILRRAHFRVQEYC